MTKITQQLGGKARQELGCLALHMLTQESGSMEHNNRVVLKH